MAADVPCCTANRTLTRGVGSDARRLVQSFRESCQLSFFNSPRAAYCQPVAVASTTVRCVAGQCIYANNPPIFHVIPPSSSNFPPRVQVSLFRSHAEVRIHSEANAVQKRTSMQSLRDISSPPAQAGNGIRHVALRPRERSAARNPSLFACRTRWPSLSLGESRRHAWTPERSNEFQGHRARQH